MSFPRAPDIFAALKFHYATQAPLTMPKALPASFPLQRGGIVRRLHQFSQLTAI
jgi:hypothetical protein